MKSQVLLHSVSRSSWSPECQEPAFDKPLSWIQHRFQEVLSTNRRWINQIFTTFMSKTTTFINRTPICLDKNTLFVYLMTTMDYFLYVSPQTVDSIHTHLINTHPFTVNTHTQVTNTASIQRTRNNKRLHTQQPIPVQFSVSHLRLNWYVVVLFRSEQHNR